MGIRLAFGVLVLFSFAGLLAAEETPSEKVVSDQLAKWTESWNKQDVEALIKLFHPESRMRKDFESSGEKKKAVKESFSEVFTQFGTIKSATVGKLIAESSKYVVKITYSEKALVAGTMKLKQDGDGHWLVLDFNIDGQGEKELKE